MLLLKTRRSSPAECAYDGYICHIFLDFQQPIFSTLCNSTLHCTTRVRIFSTSLFLVTLGNPVWYNFEFAVRLFSLLNNSFNFLLKCSNAFTQERTILLLISNCDFNQHLFHLST